MAGIFQQGWFSMGFDMGPTGSQILTHTTQGSTSSTTPFSHGLSWSTNASPGVIFGTNLAGVIHGIRMLPSALPVTSSIIYQWWDLTTNTIQITLRVFADGHLQFYLGSGTGTPIGSASAAALILPSTWVYIECSVIISSSVGFVECRINGNSTPVITTAATQNTQSSANAYTNCADFVSPGGAANFDDWYMLDKSGSSPLNTYLGNVQARGDAPNANSAVGGRNAFTPTNPTNVNFSNVANIPANSAEYNADDNPGDFDMFRFPALPGSVATVYGVNEWALLELDAAGARTVSLNCDSGGTDSLGTAFTPTAGTLVYYNQALQDDPHTAAAWTPTAAGSAELGVKVIT
jgi:hypothetical protein